MGSQFSVSVKVDYLDTVSGVGSEVLKLNGKYVRVHLNLSNLQDNVLFFMSSLRNITNKQTSDSIPYCPE